MADDATAALAAMDLVGDNGGEGSRKNSVEMPLADELTAGAVGFGDEGPEEPTPVKRLDLAFETVKQSALEDAPALQVILRVRPVPPGKETCLALVPGSSKVQTTTPSNSVNFKILGEQVKEYSFHRVLGPESTQEEVYRLTTQPLVDALYMGKSGLLFAYGVTNAGKTFTILGNEAEPGALPRALADIFARLERDQCGGEGAEGGGGMLGTTVLAGARRCSVVCSYLEVYNDQIFDLLSEEPQGGARRPALKPADRGGRIEVKGLSKHHITDVQQGLALVRQGAQNRRNAATKLNLDSSRSHSVFTIELVGKDGGAAVGTLWIVDLAGSERSHRAGSWQDSKLQREASGINTSLMKLWRCLDQLRRNQQAAATTSSSSSSTNNNNNELLVPFRESKITHLFMNHLSGAAVGKTVMLLNVNPCKEDYDETAHVLERGAGAQEIRVLKDAKRETRHRHLLGGTHDYDGRRILKRRKSLSSCGAAGGNGKGKGKGEGGRGKPAGGGGKRALPGGTAAAAAAAAGGVGAAAVVVQEEEEEELEDAELAAVYEQEGEEEVVIEDEELSGVESDTAALTRIGRKTLALREAAELLEENLCLRGTIEALKERLMRAETEIREEVAEEMAERLQELEGQVRQYREMNEQARPPSAASAGVGQDDDEDEDTEEEEEEEGEEVSAAAGRRRRGRNARATMVAGAMGGGMSARKIHLGRLQKYAAELAEEKREAEEEMARLRAKHEEEAADLRARVQELLEREERRDSLEQAPGRGLAALQEEVGELRRELEAARSEAEGWKARALKAEGCEGAGPDAAGAEGDVKQEDKPPQQQQQQHKGNRGNNRGNRTNAAANATGAAAGAAGDGRKERSKGLSDENDAGAAVLQGEEGGMDVVEEEGEKGAAGKPAPLTEQQPVGQQQQQEEEGGREEKESPPKTKQERKLRIQERIRQQIRGGKGAAGAAATEGGEGSEGEVESGPAGTAKTPIARRLRSRHGGNE